MVLIGSGLAACGTDQGEGEGGENREITFMLDFNFLGRHSFFYTALDKGYYEDEGLDVTFQKSGGSADTIKTLASGNAPLGYADAATLAVTKGQQAAAVKLVAIVYQLPSQGVFALKENGIEEPKDLEGKTMADGAGSSVTAMFPAYAEQAGIDPSKVNHTVADPSTLVSLLVSGQVDAIGQNVMGQPLIEHSAQGKEVTRLGYGDAGMDFYSNGIIASEDTLENDPELVRSFVRATLKGMEYAFENPDEAGEIFNSHHPEIDAEIAAAETEIVAELAQTPDTDANGLGHIDPDRIESTISVVEGSFDMQQDVTVDSMYADGFIED